MRKSFGKLSAADFINLEDSIKMQLDALEQIKTRCTDDESDPIIDSLLDLCFVSAHYVTEILDA